MTYYVNPSRDFVAHILSSLGQRLLSKPIIVRTVWTFKRYVDNKHHIAAPSYSLPSWPYTEWDYFPKEKRGAAQELKGSCRLWYDIACIVVLNTCHLRCVIQASVACKVFFFQWKSDQKPRSFRPNAFSVYVTSPLRVMVPDLPTVEEREGDTQQELSEGMIPLNFLEKKP